MSPPHDDEVRGEGVRGEGEPGDDDEARDTDVARERWSGRRPAPLAVAVAAAVVLGLLAAVLAILLGRDQPGPAEEVRQAAGRFGEALLTFDHADPEANRAAVLDLATGRFRADYDEAFSRGIGELITETEASSRAFVKEVFLGEVDAGAAEAIVLLDLEQDGAAGPRTVFDVYFQLRLVRVEGRWRVDDVVNLNFGDQGGLGPPGDGPVAPETPGTPVP